MIWPQKLAQQTAQPQENAQKNPQRLGLKSTTSQPKNLQPQPPPNPRLSWTCSRLGPASPAWAWILLEGRATR